MEGRGFGRLGDVLSALIMVLMVMLVLWGILAVGEQIMGLVR